VKTAHLEALARCWLQRSWRKKRCYKSNKFCCHAFEVSWNKDSTNKSLCVCVCVCVCCFVVVCFLGVKLTIWNRKKKTWDVWWYMMSWSCVMSDCWICMCLREECVCLCVSQTERDRKRQGKKEREQEREERKRERAREQLSRVLTEERRKRSET